MLLCWWERLHDSFSFSVIFSSPSEGCRVCDMQTDIRTCEYRARVLWKEFAIDSDEVCRPNFIISCQHATKEMIVISSWQQGPLRVNKNFLVFVIFGQNGVLTLVWLSLIWSLGNVVSVNAGPRHQPGLMQAE